MSVYDLYTSPPTSPSSPASPPSDDDQKQCKHCGKLILEGHAYELGDDRWHINCFRCLKCLDLLGVNLEFLVVGTGELVCKNCFYDCQVCGKKIGDLAILAGDQPYCADCFVCKHCKNRIDNLRYAKTSSGLYCMDCHEKVLQKKKRLEQEKRARRQKRNSSDPLSVGLLRTTTPIFEKTLPSIPPKSSAHNEDAIYTHKKSNSIKSFTLPFELEADTDAADYLKSQMSSLIDGYASQTAEYTDHDPVTILDPPKRSDSNFRSPSNIRTSSSRRMGFVEEDLEDEKPVTPKLNKFRLLTLPGKLGRSLLMKLPKQLISRHRKEHEESLSGVSASMFGHLATPSLSLVAPSTIVPPEGTDNLPQKLSDAKSELTSVTTRVLTLREEVESLLLVREQLLDEVLELTAQMQRLRAQIEREKMQLALDLDSSVESLERPQLTVATQSFLVQPYLLAMITPTTEEVGQIDTVQAAVKPKVKARFWRSKGFKFQKEESHDLKISAPVLQHLDDEAFAQMNNKSRVNGTPVSAGQSKGKIAFLDKFLSLVNQGTVPDVKSPVAPSMVSVPPPPTALLVEKATKENRDVPLLILTCVKFVEKHGLHSEGIYRKSGGTSQMQQLEQAFENVPDNELTSEELENALSQDVHVVSSVLKRYLRRLPEPVITHGLYDQFISCSLIKRPERKLEKIRGIVAQLPKQHRLTLHLLAKHLNLISQYLEVNYMNLHNLAIVFAPSLVRDVTGEREISDMVFKNDVTEFLVSNYRAIF